MMQHRRTFLKSALIAGMGARLVGSDRTFASAAISHNAVRGLKRRDETILRMPSMGDGYKMSWGADDQQFMVLNDGTGWSDPATKFFKRSLWSMSGSPADAVVHLVPGYPNTDRTMESEEAPHYHGHGLLAMEGRIYQFLSALDRAEDRPRSDVARCTQGLRPSVSHVKAGKMARSYASAQHSAKTEHPSAAPPQHCH
ncbi:MAG: hypothetical protein P8Y48_17265 [Novosphingobium sp.]